MDKDPTHFTKGGVIKPTILSALKAVAFRGLCMSSSLLFFAALALLVYLKRTFPATQVPRRKPTLKNYAAQLIMFGRSAGHVRRTCQK